MFAIIRQLFFLLSNKQRKQFYLLQVLVVIMSFTELLGIASIAPFMALVGDTSILEKNNVLAILYEMSGITDPMSFIFYTGLLVLIALTVSTIVSMYTTWRLSLYGASVGIEIADQLYTYYMKENWQFHASGSSAQLTKQVSTEAMRITLGIVQPLMNMNAKIILALLISISIFIYNPLIAIIGLTVFVFAYFVLYKLVRKQLMIRGRELSEVSTERFRLMNEGFGGIKDVLLLNRSSDFIERFQNSGFIYARALGVNAGISQVPRYFMELIAFGSMIGLVLLLIKWNEGDLGSVLSILAVYALAAFKLLPALQQIYVSITQIKGNISAFEAIETDLKRSYEQSTEDSLQKNDSLKFNYKRPKFNNSCQLKNIVFNYPNKETPAVNNVSMNIPANSVIGLVGSSGSGKSTLIDIFLGLLDPKSGHLEVDGVPITQQNKRPWQDMLGFVPQSIFLSEGTIAENVAFGLPNKDIDIEQVREALELANLDELVSQLPEDINTKVGERGVQLSGGQRQRIGIARALYHKADILVFDEATSALDGITEKIIMDAIHDFSGKKTIIMIAHRLKTVQKCDTIFLMEKGEIVDSGTYDYLVENNPQFREMALHS